MTRIRIFYLLAILTIVSCKYHHLTEIENEIAYQFNKRGDHIPSREYFEEKVSPESYKVTSTLTSDLESTEYYKIFSEYEVKDDDGYIYTYHLSADFDTLGNIFDPYMYVTDNIPKVKIVIEDNTMYDYDVEYIIE